jgi:hypothetical protein
MQAEPTSTEHDEHRADTDDRPNQPVEREASPHGGRRPSTGGFHGREANRRQADRRLAATRVEKISPHRRPADVLAVDIAIPPYRRAVGPHLDLVSARGIEDRGFAEDRAVRIPRDEQIDLEALLAVVILEQQLGGGDVIGGRRRARRDPDEHGG